MTQESKSQVSIIGAGPAGLMAAEYLSARGFAVTVFERMPSAARRLLMAGRGGLNLTHSEPLPAFLSRYGEAQTPLKPAIEAFPPEASRNWAEALGQETFVGSSGRVFPKAMKASPLLRAWLARLRDEGVEMRLRQEWRGWDSDGRLLFRQEDGSEATFATDAVLLALGGASWPRLGARGDWVELLRTRNIEVRPFRPANCGFTVDWSDHFRNRFAGTPVKNVALSFQGRRLRGEFVVTSYGLEGGAIYALSAVLRDAIAGEGQAVLRLDLRPNLSEAALRDRLLRVGEAASLANRLRKGAGLTGVAAGLLREGTDVPREAGALAARIKSLPLTLAAAQGLERAISSAGGIAWSELGPDYMLKRLPGTFVAGEMLDWEASTGGYLLQACFATGLAAAKGVASWLER
ncbi:NAD(P)/FAD-dependent oxidoreductase [Aquibaculum sediminis]|uniref:NAD(P)/FAD-dependent oxidoreductase n=1 Tax=Aquibaculum sediminis TaxID=3231907 RepID=UPI0034549662